MVCPYDHSSSTQVAPVRERGSANYPISRIIVFTVDMNRFKICPFDKLCLTFELYYLNELTRGVYSALGHWSTMIVATTLRWSS